MSGSFACDLREKPSGRPLAGALAQPLTSPLACPWTYPLSFAAFFPRARITVSELR